MAMTAFGLQLVAQALSARSETGTLFDRDVVVGRRQLELYALSLLFIVLGSELGVLQRVLGTESLTGGQWLVCLGVAAALLAVNEVIKIFVRARSRRPAAAVEVEVAGAVG